MSNYQRKDPTLKKRAGQAGVEANNKNAPSVLKSDSHLKNGWLYNNEP